MSTYAIGDVQGCYRELQQLLKEINFNHQNDTLWFTGDLVNRGPQSLEVLRFVRSLGAKQVTVLGNHDLHLLALALGKRMIVSDELEEVLNAPDKEELIDWLRSCPLLHYDEQKKYVMTHAGLAPVWTLEKSRHLAKEVESVLQTRPQDFLLHMYGNKPDEWSDDLQGIDRLRCITNYLTRLRYCYFDGRMDFDFKGEISKKPDNIIPWFDVPQRKNANIKIIFGHWAALGGQSDAQNVFALDTGCVWGNCLTTMRLEDGKRFSVRCDKYSRIG